MNDTAIRMNHHRAQRIAEASGDADPVEVDGHMAIVAHTPEAAEVAERLVWCQGRSFDVYLDEQVVSCDDCGEYESRPLTDVLPQGWAEQLDAQGNLIGFLCPEHAGTQ